MNDDKYLKLTRMEMEADLYLQKKFKDKIKEYSEEKDYDEWSEDWEEVEDNGQISRKPDGAKVKLQHGFTEEEIDKFMEE